MLDQEVLPGECFDLVMMSALLPYEWRKDTLPERVEFGERLLRRLRPGGHLLVIEPRAKLEELEVLASCLERTGIAYEIGETNTAAEGNRMLSRSTDLWWSWYPHISASSMLSIEAGAMLGGDEPFTFRAGSVRPDVMLTGVRRISVSTPEAVYPRVRLQTRPPSAIAAPQPERTRKRPSTPARLKLAWAAGAAAGVIAAAFLVARLL